MPTFGPSADNPQDIIEVEKAIEEALKKPAEEPQGVNPELLDALREKTEEFANKNQQPPTLSLRERLALDFLKALMTSNAEARQSYNTRTYVRQAFSYADQFMEQANSYRGECEMEELW